MALKSVSKADPNYVPNYQLAAIPFVTSSAAGEVKHNATIQINFPFATKYLKINNTGGNPLRVGFTAHGVDDTVVGDNYFVIPSANAGDVCIQDFDVRCKSIFFRVDASSGTTDFSLFAGLTPIGSGSFPIITGSNGFEGVG